MLVMRRSRPRRCHSLSYRWVITTIRATAPLPHLAEEMLSAKPAMTNHWEAYHRHWALLGPPLRPPAEAVEAVWREAGCLGANVLLLGVTPELAGLGKTLRA